MTFCGNCGTENPDRNNFCCFCGSALRDGGMIPPVAREPAADAGFEEKARIGAYDPNMDYATAGAAAATAGAAEQAQPANYDPQEAMKNYDEPAANPRNGMRYGGIILALIAFGLTAALLFIIPLNVTGWDTSTTLYNLAVNGTAKDLAIIGFVIAALAIGIFSIIVPVFSLVSGATVISIVVALYYKHASTIGMDFNSLLIILGLGIVVILLGVIASVMMSKYVRSVKSGVSMFSSCIFTWIGVPRKN